jgi:hypothetical protein
MLSPFRLVLQEYYQLLLKMAFDNLTIQVIASNLENIVNVETFLNLVCIILLLITIKNLIKLAQAQVVFVIDLVQVIKLT